MKDTDSKKGFTVLYASLIGGLVLAVGAAILLITIKQVALSAAGRESQFAFYAADSATECVLFLNKVSVTELCPDGIFPGPNAASDCGLANMLSNSANKCFPSADSTWIGINPTSVSQTTGVNSEVISEFDIGKSDDPDITNNICARVTVVKSNTQTTITSRGFSTCATTGNRFERAIETTF